MASLLCYFGQSKQSLTRLSVIPISKCPALPCTPFENQSNLVQLITLKATGLLTKHSMNEGESATDIYRVIFMFKILPHTNVTC